jgi:hypothetical protein
MRAELTDSQHQALDPRHGEPGQFVDPRTKKVYILVSVDEFAKAQEALAELEDQALQQGIADAARRSVIQWIKENPY